MWREIFLDRVLITGRAWTMQNELITAWPLSCRSPVKPGRAANRWNCLSEDRKRVIMSEQGNEIYESLKINSR